MKYPEEIYAERIKELEDRIAYLEAACDGDCIPYNANPLAGHSDLAPGNVTPSTKLEVVRTDNPSVGLVFKLGDGGTTYPVHSINMIGSSDD